MAYRLGAGFWFQLLRLPVLAGVFLFFVYFIVTEDFSGHRIKLVLFFLVAIFWLYLIFDNVRYLNKRLRERR